MHDILSEYEITKILKSSGCVAEIPEEPDTFEHCDEFASSIIGLHELAITVFDEDDEDSKKLISTIEKLTSYCYKLDEKYIGTQSYCGLASFPNKKLNEYIENTLKIPIYSVNCLNIHTLFLNAKLNLVDFTDDHKKVLDAYVEYLK